MISDNVRKIQERIEWAARKSGRHCEDICLVAATKSVSFQQLEEAYEAQLRHFGENRLQEAQEKIKRLGHRPGVAWHFIGRMQRRKLRDLVGQFFLLHSVESLEQAKQINELAGHLNIRQEVLLEVNVGAEDSKGGFSLPTLKEVMNPLDQLVHLQVRGLMAIPPWKEDPEDVRPFFARIRELRDELSRHSFRRIRLEELSMGMSHDYHVAVEEGATLVRIGTAIFGARSQ
jgi:PLP dependent protein